MSDTILATKLFAPPLRPGLIRRTGLLQRLTADWHGRLTLVSAPAGFGKSTLLADLCQQLEGPVAWLSLDVSESTPKVFFQYWLAALQRHHNALFEQSSASLQSPEQVIDESWLTTFLNELASLPARLTLILDDFHRLQSTELQPWLVWLIERLPATLQLVIASREDPPLPLARWRVNGWLQEVRAQELRFSHDEVVDFFRHTIPVALSDQSLLALEQRTEGWVAGLQLAGLSLAGLSASGLSQNGSSPTGADNSTSEHAIDSFIKRFSGSHRYVFDYLVEEVLNQLDQQTRDFLLDSCLLERLEPQLCDAMLQPDRSLDSRRILQWLEQNNLFLIALDDQRRWFRYHHLFAEVLRSQAAHSDARRCELLSRASRWYQQQGMYTEAIDLAAQAGNQPLQAELLELHWPEMRFYCIENLFVDWMRALPRSVWQRSPVLGAYYGLTELSFDVALGEQVLEYTRQSLAADPQGSQLQILNRQAFESVPGILAIGAAYMAGARQDMEGVLTNSQLAEQCLPQRDHIWRGAAAAMQGMVSWAMGELPQAQQKLSQSLACMEDSGDHSAELAAWYVYVDTLIQQGRMDDAFKANDKAMALLQRCEPRWYQASADTWVIRSELEFERANQQQAIACLEKAESLGMSARLPQAARHLPLMRARIAMAAQQFDEAQQQIDIAMGLHMDCPTPDARPLAAWQAWCQLLMADTERPLQWLQQQGLLAFAEAGSQLPVFYMKEFELLLVVRWALYCRANGKHTDTLASIDESGLLGKLERLAEQQQRYSSLLEIHLLQAQQALLCGQHQQALEYHVRARQQAEQWQLQQRWQAATELHQALSSLAADADERIDQSSLTEQLSSRELDVLALLATDLTGPQIAERLFVSLNTFRTHSKNIYTKLDVQNRQGAILAARRLGLLE